MDSVNFILQKVLLAVLFVECFMGTVLNVFIVVVQFVRWKALKSMETRDKIITCLGISRSLFLANVVFAYIVALYFSHWTNQNVFLTLIIWFSGMMLHYTNLWITTVLYMFYCLKIASYCCTWFIFMKTNISRLVPPFIVASLLVSVASSLPFGMYVFWLRQENSANFSLRNVTMNISNFQHKYQDQVIIFSVGSLLPFLLFSGAIYLLIQSLWRHTRQMRSNGTSFRSPNLEAHFDVAKSMILFFLCQVIYFSSMICSFSDMLNINDPWNIGYSILICSPSFLHSAYMVYGNAKLKQAFKELCYGLMKCC